MLPIQCVPGLRVVEAGRRRIPMHHLEVDAIVVGMTFDAGRTCRAGTRIRGVQAMVLQQFGGDLFVTFKASERRGARRYLVTFGTVRVSAQALMGSGERSRRYLAMADTCIATCQN